VKRPLANVVWDLAEEPEGDFFARPWHRAQQLPLESLAGDLPMIEFAMCFVLSNPDVDTLLIGTVSRRHQSDNIRILAS